MKTQITSRDIVLEFIHALNTENFKLAKSWLNESFTFNGPLGTRNGSEIYIADMEKMKLKYSIQKTFEEGNDVCVIYNIDMGGKTIMTVGLYHIEDTKLSSLRVFFDPRPLLEGNS